MCMKDTVKRIISVVVVLTFFIQQTSWAMPVIERNVTTLAVEGMFQTAPMTDLGMDAQKGLFPSSAFLYTLRNVAGFMLEDEKLLSDKAARDKRLRFLEGVLRFDALEMYRRLEAHAENMEALDPATIRRVIESAGLKKGDDKLDPAVDLSRVRFHPDDDRIVSILYKRPERTFVVNMALRGTVAPRDMPGREIELTGISEKYIVSIMFEDGTGETGEDAGVLQSALESPGQRQFVTMPASAGIPGYREDQQVLFGAPNAWIDDIDPKDEDAKEDIARQTADEIIASAEFYVEKTARPAVVAVLSYATTKRGSKISQDPYVYVMERAVNMVREERPDIHMTGPGSLQFDAAVYGSTFISKTGALPNEDIEALIKGGIDLDQLLLSEDERARAAALGVDLAPLNEIIEKGFLPNVFIFPHINSLMTAKGQIDLYAARPDQVEQDASASFLAEMESQAAAGNRRIAIPEATNPEILKAVARFIDKGIGEITLISEKSAIAEAVKQLLGLEAFRMEIERGRPGEIDFGGVNVVVKEAIESLGAIADVELGNPTAPELSLQEIQVLAKMYLQASTVNQHIDGLKIINPRNETDEIKSNLEKFARNYCKVQGHKITPAMIRVGIKVIKRSKSKYLELNYGAGMVKDAQVDCMVAGKVYDSEDVILAIKTLVGTASGVKTVSGGFLMQSPVQSVGMNGRVILSDIAFEVCPNADELAEVAVNTARDVEALITPEVKIAFVADKGTQSPKITRAIKKAKELSGGKYIIDGPITMEEAMRGSYNGIIFSDLSAGNINYKIAQRVGGFTPMAIVTGGSSKVVFDMSRGERAQGIYNTMVTAGAKVSDRDCALTVNCGSSSVKYKLYDMSTDEVLDEGNIENISEDGSKGPTHEQAIKQLIDGLPVRPEEIKAVGHRVVHGGEILAESKLIDAEGEIEGAIEENISLAPLHNPANLIGIRECKKQLPHAAQVAVPDTAVHQTMNPEVFLYAIPYYYYKKYKLRRYGFHGTSHRYVARRAAALDGRPFEKLNIITCHLGNGASIAAFKNGKVVTTSMGVTPLEGLIMGTRSGNLDPALVSIIAKEEGVTSEFVTNVLLNKKSGLLGVSGISNDMRDLENAVAEGSLRARLARRMFALRLTEYIGAYETHLGGADIIVFTGGIGEKDKEVQREVCSRLAYRGLALDEEAVMARGSERVISTPASSLKAMVISTDEELVIMEDTRDLLRRKEYQDGLRNDPGIDRYGAMMFKMGIPEEMKRMIIGYLNSLGIDAVRVGALEGPLDMDYILKRWGKDSGISFSIRDIELDLTRSGKNFDFTQVHDALELNDGRMFLEWYERLIQAYPDLDSVKLLRFSLGALKRSVETVIVRSNLSKIELIEKLGAQGICSEEDTFQHIFKKAVIGQTNAFIAAKDQPLSVRGKLVAPELREENGLLRYLYDLGSEYGFDDHNSANPDVAPGWMIGLIANAVHCPGAQELPEEMDDLLSAEGRISTSSGIRSILDVSDDELIELAPYELNKAHIYRLKNMIDILWQPGNVDGDPAVIEGYRNLIHKLAIAQAVSSLYGCPDMATTDWQGDDPRDFLRAHDIYIPREMEFFMENNMFVRDKAAMFERIRTADYLPSPDVSGIDLTDNEKREWMARILVYFTLADSIEMGADYLRTVELRQLKGQAPRNLETPAESLAFMLSDFSKRTGGEDTRSYLATELLSKFDDRDNDDYRDLMEIYVQASGETHLPEAPRSVMDVEESEMFELTANGRNELNRTHAKRVLGLFDILWSEEYIEGSADEIEKYRNICHKFFLTHVMGSSYGRPDMADIAAPIDTSYEALEEHHLTMPEEVEVFIRDSVFRDKKAALKGISDNDAFDDEAKAWLKKMFVYFTLADTMDMGADYLRVKELPVLKGKTPRDFESPAQSFDFMRRDFERATGESVEAYLSPGTVDMVTAQVAEDYERMLAITGAANREAHLAADQRPDGEFASLVETLENTVNNTRAKLEKTANLLIDYLRESTLPDSVFQTMPFVDRDESTIEMKRKLEGLLDAIGQFEGEKKLPADISFAESDIAFVRENIDQLEADSVIAGIIALTRKAVEKARLKAADKVNEKVVVALDFGWVPGFNKGTLQHNALSPVLSVVSRIDDVLQSIGINNVEIMPRGENEGLSAWAERVKTSGDSNGDLSNILMLGSKEATVYFDEHVQAGLAKKQKAFLAGVNPRLLYEYYEAYGEEENHVMEIEILEMLSLAVELANGINASDDLIERGSYDPIERKVIFLPLPPMDEMEYSKILEKYRNKKVALMAA